MLGNCFHLAVGQSPTRATVPTLKMGTHRPAHGLPLKEALAVGLQVEARGCLTRYSDPHSHSTEGRAPGDPLLRPAGDRACGLGVLQRSRGDPAWPLLGVLFPLTSMPLC